MCHPANKMMNSPSMLVTVLCVTICQQDVTDRTRDHCVVLCFPGQEGHTVVVLKDWRQLTKESELAVYIYIYFIFLSLFIFF